MKSIRSILINNLIIDLSHLVLVIKRFYLKEFFFNKRMSTCQTVDEAKFNATLKVANHSFN